jgi:hypothetical protein
MPKDKPAKTEKPKLIEIVSVKFTRKTVDIAYTQGDSAYTISERDNPLPSFSASIASLAPIVTSVCHLPLGYDENGMRVASFKLGTKGGAPTISIRAKKDLDDASKQFVFDTPERLLDQPTEEGSYSPPLKQEFRDLIAEAIAEAKLYVKGERAQGQIAFEDNEDDDEQDKDALKFDATGAQ